MPQTIALIGSQRTESALPDVTAEQELRVVAARAGLRLQKSRRQNDLGCGPTLYWLFDVASRRSISSQSGWTLEHVRRYLSA